MDKTVSRAADTANRAAKRLSAGFHQQYWWSVFLLTSVALFIGIFAGMLLMHAYDHPSQKPERPGVPVIQSPPPVKANARNAAIPFSQADADASLKYAKDHVFERVSVARDYEILAEALRHGRGQIDREELKKLLSAQESSGIILRKGDEIATQKQPETGTADDRRRQ